MSAVMVLEVAARQILALTFLSAGIVKLFDSKATANIIKAYEIIPERLATAVGLLLPKFELILSAFLIFNIYRFYALSAYSAILGVFTFAQLSVLSRGKIIPCGCFGGSEAIVTTKTMFRTLSLLVLAIFCLCLDWRIAQSQLRLGRYSTDIWVTQMEATCLFGLALSLLQARRNDAILKKGHLPTSLIDTPRMHRNVSSNTGTRTIPVSWARSAK